MARLPDDTQLLAIGLLSAADDEGYFRADPAIIRADIAPFREDLGRISGMIRELIGSEWISVFDHPTQGPIGKVLTMEKHQKIYHPTPSKLKGYYNSGIIPESFPKSSGEVPESFGLSRAPADQGSGIRDQGKEQGKEQGSGKTSPGGGVPEKEPARKFPHQEIRVRLNAIFRRSDVAPWGNDEEHYLVDVSRRPEVLIELSEIEAFFKIGSYRPEKVRTLLSDWTGVLDRARNHNENTKRNSPTTPKANSGTLNAGASTGYSAAAKRKLEQRNQQIQNPERSAVGGNGEASNPIPG